jgi:hypothetical protein
MQTFIRWIIGFALLIGLASVANIWLGVAGFGIWMLLSRRLHHVTPTNTTPTPTKTVGAEDPEASEGMGESLRTRPREQPSCRT